MAGRPPEGHPALRPGSSGPVPGWFNALYWAVEWTDPLDVDTDQEMIDVVIAMLMVVSILTATLYLCAHVGRRQLRRATESALLPDPAPPGAPFDSDGELAEATLVSALLAGELPTAEYQWGMALLAAGDAVRHPLAVPPEHLV